MRQLTKPPQTPRRRVPQNDRRQPQICGRPQEPATPGHLSLLQVCVFIPAVVLDCVPFRGVMVSCFCFRVSDIGIQCLTEGSSSTKLRELNVSHCSHITDISVMRIAQRYIGIFTGTRPILSVKLFYTQQCFVYQVV